MTSKKRTLTEGVKKTVAFEQEYKCMNCSKLLPASYEIDHKVPFSISQDDSRENLTALCPNCHAKKTQSEYKRILHLKKILPHVPENHRMCYYCLETYTTSLKNNHKCNKILVDIDLFIDGQRQTLHECDKYLFIKPLLGITQQSTNEDDSTLKISIEDYYIFVNNYFTDRGKLTPNDIAKAVKIATRTKRDFKRYSNIEITIDLEKTNDIDGTDDCITYIDRTLPSLLPARIFKDGTEITYTYIIIE